MDRNSITGIILIALLVVGYNIIYPPIIEEENTTQQDSTSTTLILEETKEDESTIEEVIINKDNLSSEERISKYGAFAIGASGSDDAIILKMISWITYFCKEGVSQLHLKDINAILYR